MCRDPGGSADFRAEVESGQPCGCSHGATACGASGRARGVPRVQRWSEHRVVRLDVLVPRGHVGLADDQRTCGTQPSHRLGVLFGHVVLEVGPTTDGPQTSGLVAVLQRDRQTANEVLESLSAGPERVVPLRLRAQFIGDNVATRSSLEAMWA